MMRTLTVEPFHFAKTAGKRVRGGRIEWEREVERMLAETAQFAIQGGPEIRIEWDEHDTEQGFALGKVIVANRPPQPAVLPRQEQQMDRLGVGEPEKTAIIPIHVENSEIGNLSIFLDDKGMAHPLTEKRWSEFMGSFGRMGEVDPNTPDPQSAGTGDLPHGAAGYDRLSNVKMAGEFPLLGLALPHLHPSDLERMRKTAADEPVMAGFAASRLLPVVQLIMRSSAISTRDYDQAVLGSLPVNIVHVEEVEPAPTSATLRKYRATMISDRYFAPRHLEGTYSDVAGQMSKLVPGIGAMLEQGGEHVVQLDRMRKVEPLVLEDVTTKPDPVMGEGNWMVMSKQGEVLRMDVVPNCFEFNGKPSGCMLFVGDGCYGMSDKAWGHKMGGDAVGYGRFLPPHAPLRRGAWVSIALPDGKFMVPMEVHASSCSSRHLIGMTYGGTPVCVKFVDGLEALVPAGSAAYPDMGIADGEYGKYFAPGGCMILPLGDSVSIEDEAFAVQARLQSFVRSGGYAEGTTRVRFSHGDEEERSYVTMRRMGDEFSLKGLPVGSVVGQNSADAVSEVRAKFILAVLGCSDAQISRLMALAGSKGCITIAGLRSVRRVVEEGGKIQVPYLENMGKMAVRLRADVTDSDRDTLFKGAACIDRIGLGQKVADAMRDPAFVAKLEKVGSFMSKFASYGEPGIAKMAEVFAHPESIDTMLGLNVLNERNLTQFLRNLPRIRRTEDHLAELLMLARQGLSGVKADDVEEAMRATNRITEKLEYLEKQVSERASMTRYD